MAEFKKYACMAYLIQNGENTEFIVNLKNLALFVQEHKYVSEIVVVGHYDNHFVLSFKEGKIDICSDPVVKKFIETEMKTVKFVNRPKLHSYKGFIQCLSVRTINISSTSLLEAEDDIQKWTIAPLKHLIKIA